jgi:hypothetical protein
MNYLLGTGYCHRPDAEEAERMWGLWRANTAKATPPPRRIVVVAAGGAAPPSVGGDTDVLHLAGNLGHIHHLIGKELPHKSHMLGGWSASVLALALIAYCDEADFLYKEADCLAFGSWVEQMYADLGDADIVFGGPMKSEPWMSCAQSLFLVKHRAIPSFIAKYLALGNDSETMLTEDKFAALSDGTPAVEVRQLSFGVDRERPIPLDAPVFYAQQLTNADIESLKLTGLI